MTIANYSDLKTRVAEWTSRNDLSSRIDDAIDLFEAEIVTSLPLVRENTTSTANTVAGTKTVNVPSDMEALNSVSIEGYTAPLPQMSRAAAFELYGDLTGQPRAFSYDGGDSIELWPTPVSVLTVTFGILGRLDSLSLDTPTNWLITKHPHIYLYGVLRHISNYVEDEERRANIEPQYNVFLSGLVSSQKRRMFANGQAVIRVQGSTP